MARIFALVFVLLLAACSLPYPDRIPAPPPPSKLSDMLRQQVDARRQQCQSPSPQNLQQMHDLGMIIDDISLQRVYLYLEQPLSGEQEQQLQALGIELQLDSWIPPLGDNAYGFLIAKVPVHQIEALAGLDYVVRLDTAERQGLPTCEILPRP